MSVYNPLGHKIGSIPTHEAGLLIAVSYGGDLVQYYPLKGWDIMGQVDQHGNLTQWCWPSGPGFSMEDDAYWGIYDPHIGVLYKQGTGSGTLRGALDVEDYLENGGNDNAILLDQGMTESEEYKLDVEREASMERFLKENAETPTPVSEDYTRERIQNAVNKMPYLTANGACTHAEALGPRFFGDRDPVVEEAEALEDLLSHTADFEKTCKWIDANLSPIKSINDRSTSYGLKHVVERDVGYLTNGCFIAAMVDRGYKFKIDPGTPNVLFNISSKALRKVSVRQKAEAKAKDREARESGTLPQMPPIQYP